MQIKNDSSMGGIQSTIPYQNNVYAEECQISPKTMKVDPTIGHLPCIRYQEPVYQETHPGYTDVGSSSPTSTCNDSPLNVEDSPPIHPHVGQSSPNCPVTRELQRISCMQQHTQHKYLHVTDIKVGIRTIHYISHSRLKHTQCMHESKGHTHTVLIESSLNLQ